MMPVYGGMIQKHITTALATNFCATCPELRRRSWTVLRLAAIPATGSGAVGLVATVSMLASLLNWVLPALALTNSHRGMGVGSSASWPGCFVRNQASDSGLDPAGRLR